ncbi:MAG: EF-hand domain-containing protein [Candidatus Marithrix sp.]|nr:EF-hand domain-containing protein [Candidatus Marithrix sp.]
MKIYVLLLPVIILVTACSHNNYRHRDHDNQRANFNLSQFDANNDGKVSRTEFLNTKLPNGRTPSETRFNRLDSNNDNHITQDEFDAMKSKRSNRNRD